MALKNEDLLVVQPGGVQPDPPNAPRRCTVSDFMKLAPGQSLLAVTTVGNTTTKDIILQDAGGTPSIQLQAATGTITSAGTVTIGTGGNEIKLDASTGEITANDIITSGPVQGDDIQAGSGANAILLDGSTGQIGSDDDTNFMDGGTYASQA